MKIVTTALATLVSLLNINTVFAGANLLVNGGFELPGLPNPSDYVYLPNGSTFVPGWVSVDNIPSGSLFVDNLLIRAPYYGFPASEGSYFIYVDNNNGPSPSLNGIYQDFSTLVDQQYSVTFDASTEIAYGTPGLLGVSVGDTMLHYTLPNVPGYPAEPYVFTGWSSYSFTFQATSTMTRLQFFDEGYQIGGDPTKGNASPLLDNVTVSLLPAAVPEPSSIAMFGIGAIGMMFARRKRQQTKLAA